MPGSFNSVFRYKFDWESCASFDCRKHINAYLPDLVAELMALSARLKPSADPNETNGEARINATMLQITSGTVLKRGNVHTMGE